jgi:hypothetical protein
MMHISPRVRGKIQIAKGGKWCCVKPTQHLQAQPTAIAVGAKRGAIGQFSDASRSRLIQVLSKTPKAAYARGVVLITLTYPGEYPKDPHLWKSQLDRMGKRLRRKAPCAAFLWKLEPQERGAPHFHVMGIGVRYIDREWVARSWYEIVGSGDPDHLKAGTRIEAPKGMDPAAKYASKYVSKPQESTKDYWQWPGRWWGVIGRSNLGIEIETYSADKEAFSAVHRTITAYKQEHWEKRPAEYRARVPYPDMPLGVGGWWRLEDWLVQKLLANGWHRLE